MNKSRKDTVASKIVGLVYTDIVVYILPGFFLISGILIMFGLFSKEIIKEISSVSFSGLIIFAILLPASSYIAGIFLSFFRWNLYPYRPYKGNFGRLLYESTIIPEYIRKKTMEKILNDMEHLKLLPPKQKKSLRNSDTVPPKDEMILLFDWFWGMMIDSARESSLNIFSFYDRWDDICGMTENLIISTQILSIIVTIKLISISTSYLWILISICGAFILILLLAGIYLFIIPRQRIKFMSHVLFSYLSGRLKVYEK